MPSKTNIPLSPLTAISPLDGRYRSHIEELSLIVSEFGLIKTRFHIEAYYLLSLAKEGIIRKFSKDEQKLLMTFADNISLADATLVKEKEKETRHDVKAMEYVMRQKLAKTSLKDILEMIHFGLTSEDINNIANRLMLKDASNVLIKDLNTIIDGLVTRAEKDKATPMLARTHGQAAVPTTLGKELVVFAMRLHKEVQTLKRETLTGKCNGAVGNFNAAQFAYPNIDWISFSETFIHSLNLKPNLYTTQINPYDDIITYLQTFQRINTILVDFSQDMWRYISDNWFIQENKKGEVGSSTMPQKVNPIDFENAEGNLQIANSLIEGFTRKLAVSRLQRDLSDSTTTRNIGSALAYSLLAYKSLQAGLSRISVNYEQITNDLNYDYAILTEATQTLLRKEQIPNAYTKIKTLSRGKHIDKNEWQRWTAKLDIDEKLRQQLSKLSPENYIGLAKELTEKAIKEIRKKMSLRTK